MKKAFSRKNAWEALPPGLKRVVGSALSLVPPRLLLGGTFRRTAAFLDEAQWWDVERIRAFQLEKLRRLCLLAHEKSSFYRARFGSAGFDPRGLASVDHLGGVPTIGRADVQAHLEEMLVVDPRSPRVDFTSTGGTSGIPLRFYIGSDRSQVEYAYLVAGWRRAGYRLGDRMAVFRGRVVAPRADGLHHEHDPLLRHHYYSAFHMTDENVGRYLAHVDGLGGCVLHVYPSSATALARYLKRSGRPAPAGVRAILAESEIVYPEQRALVEETFRCRLFSGYGQTEKVVAAAECESSTLDHVWPTYGFFELLDDAGRPVTTKGQRGEIVGTSFVNAVMPFIRYRTGDHATYVSDRCEACGRVGPVLSEIRGHRTQEMLVLSDGAHVSWTALNVHDDTFDNVRQFQFRQDVPGRAVLRVVATAAFGAADEQRIRASLDRKFDRRMSFDIVRVDEIPLSRSGKAIYVDQGIAGVGGP